MHRRRFARIVLTLALVTSVGLAAQAAVASADTSTSVAEKKKKKKPTVKLAESTYGKILVAADGRTLYAFDPDGTDTSASKCTGDCATAWPPLVVTSNKAKAGKGLDPDGLVVAEGGHVAYSGHLLYKFSGDAAAGDTNGQGVAGVWHVVTADGATVPG